MHFSGIVKHIMSTLDFSAINQSSTLSFKAQRNLIKKLGQGKRIPCDHCQQPLTLTALTAADAVDKTGVRCAIGCTNIALEFVN